MSLLDNPYVKASLGGGIGGAAGAHVATVVGGSKMVEGACIGGGCAVGTYTTTEDMKASAIAGGIGFAVPYITPHVAKTDKTRAAVQLFLGIAAGVAGQMIAERF